eukprot:CAMPEP_0205913662 /NCGR_PEP_ID=MMETSP1325-20131115/6698_1 /ASSEMBLY_ACC=CAM_ASM_000708 /TAXON_ID=236786 /ORGANISM="Florenciella sp., Strain RCC1007" /LENGTH=62 /DNA_ID=CAMNT_0053280575 /DNA_START=43 /DNA_END=228 /DNA_ORIENTATION=+
MKDVLAQGVISGPDQAESSVLINGVGGIIWHVTWRPAVFVAPTSFSLFLFLHTPCSSLLQCA